MRRCSHYDRPIHAAGFCRACYDKKWRESQGPDSKYRKRAAMSSAKRKRAA